MRISKIPSSEITDESLYLNRREWLAAAGVVAAGMSPARLRAAARVMAQNTDDKPTPYATVTGYNNYYEFGTDKDDPARNAGTLRSKPWHLAIEGDVKKPGVYAVDDLFKGMKPEERVYRHRCVEAWSIVVPWLGIPLKDVIARLEPGSRAKYVEFVTLYDPEQMPETRRHILDWPYLEALRMDEAMHPLTLLTVGLYGKPLPNQNGAPVRLTVPWKYGFKSGKSLVKIRFVEKPPETTWALAAPNEYGFYANVNPTVDHPRWSQATERRLGEFFRRKTLMFNGYADQVASLYTGMDLRKNF